MAWSGGTFTRANPTWASDAQGMIGIEPGRHDAQDNDFTTGINQCINKDGSNAMTGNLNLNTNKIVGLTNGTTDTDAISLGQAKAGIDIQTTTTNRLLSKFSADSAGLNQIFQKSRSATVGTNTVVQNGDSLGAIVFQGANGTGYNVAGAIGCKVDGTPGLNDMPGMLTIATTPDGSSSAVDAIVIDNQQRVGVNRAPLVGVQFVVKSKTSNGTDTICSLVNSSDATMFLVSSDGATYTGNGGGSPYNLHTLNAANMYVESNGLLYRSVSASKYKDDIQNMSYGLDTVKQLRPVTYKLKGDETSNRRFAGLIAEEVNDLGLTEFVQYDANNQPDALNYSHFVALAFKAIQELSAKVEELEARLPEVSEPA
jgi:hypothetical protein